MGVLTREISGTISVSNLMKLCQFPCVNIYVCSDQQSKQYLATKKDNRCQ